MNLIIVGNGFDINHGLQTAFLDFKNFIKDKKMTCLPQMCQILYMIWVKIGAILKKDQDGLKKLKKQIKQSKSQAIWV